MAMVGLRVPPETARLLSGIEVDGKREARGDYHVTLLFLGSGVPIEQLAKALGATHSVTSTTKPFTVSTSRIGCFPKGPDGVPIICRVDSDELHELHGRLRKAFDEAGIKYSKRHPKYKPHMTLSYSDKEIEDTRIPKIEWGAHEVVLWGGDSGDDRVMMVFPLTLDLPKVGAITARVAARYQRERGLG